MVIERVRVFRANFKLNLEAFRRRRWTLLYLVGIE